MAVVTTIARTMMYRPMRIWADDMKSIVIGIRYIPYSLRKVGKPEYCIRLAFSRFSYERSLRNFPIASLRSWTVCLPGTG